MEMRDQISLPLVRDFGISRYQQNSAIYSVYNTLSNTLSSFHLGDGALAHIATYINQESEELGIKKGILSFSFT